ncbi:hypothetical protein LSAT2_007548 [Lamellibrachia satsuma]|nr:hypothetical protein LSAT2_007548 [Lamellibrachia satsuma]
MVRVRTLMLMTKDVKSSVDENSPILDTQDEHSYDTSSITPDSQSKHMIFRLELTSQQLNITQNEARSSSLCRSVDTGVGRERYKQGRYGLAETRK